MWESLYYEKNRCFCYFLTIYVSLYWNNWFQMLLRQLVVAFTNFCILIFAKSIFGSMWRCSLSIVLISRIYDSFPNLLLHRSGFHQHRKMKLAFSYCWPIIVFLRTWNRIKNTSPLRYSEYIKFSRTSILKRFVWGRLHFSNFGFGKRSCVSVPS